MENPERKKLSIAELFKSRTRLLIYALLSIHIEMNLNEMSKVLKKSKSTLSEHLQKMMKAGLVVVSREEKIRGNIKAKYFCLAENAEESVYEIKPRKDIPVIDQIREGISIYMSFADLNIYFIKLWRDYLLDLLKQIDQGQIEKVHQVWKEIKHNSVRFSIESSYSTNIGKFLEKEITELFKKADQLEKENRENVLHSEFQKTCFVTNSIIPLNYILKKVLDEEE